MCSVQPLCQSSLLLQGMIHYVGRGVKGGRKKERIKLKLKLIKSKLYLRIVRSILCKLISIKVVLQPNLNIYIIYLILYIHFLFFEENAGNIGH